MACDSQDSGSNQPGKLLVFGRVEGWEKQPGCGSPVHEIFQARVLEWVAIFFSRGSSQPQDRTRVSRIVGRICLKFFSWRDRVFSPPPRHSVSKPIYFLLANDPFSVISSPQSSYQMAQTVKRLPAMWETRVRSLSQEDPLEKEMATHSSTLAWKTPWTEEGTKSQRRLSDFTFYFFFLFLSFFFPLHR